MVRDKLTNWAQRHPDTLSFFDDLNHKQVLWGLFSGGQVQFLPHARAIDDHDVLTDEIGFYSIASLRGVNVQKKDVLIRSDDDNIVSYITYEASLELDGKIIQVMLPVDMYCSNGSVYSLSMTRLAASRRLSEEVNGVVVYAAHPFDTALAKAGLQRPNPKQDASDVRTLADHYDLVGDYPYAIARAQEFGADYRVDEFLSQHAGFVLGRLAVVGQVKQLALV